MVISSLAGLLAGWLICWISDRLPALGVTNENRSAAVTAPKQSPYALSHQPGRLTQLTAAVMLITAVLYVYLWHILQFSRSFFLIAALCTFFILVGVIDLKYHLILNVLILPAIGLLLVYHFFPVSPSSWYALLGGVVTFLLFLLVALLSSGGLGGGDIKLAALLGVTFGYPYVFWALLAGALTGGATAVFFLLVRRWHPKAKIPYGPFLCLGAIVALLVNPLPWLTALLA